MSNDSPLIKPVVKRDNNRDYNFKPPKADAFTEDVSFEEVVEDSTQDAGTPPPSTPRGGGSPPDASAFDEDVPPREGSPDIPNYEKEDGDFDHETDQAKEQAIETDRKMLIATILEGVDWVVPEGAHWITRIDTEKLEEYRKKNRFFVVDVDALKERNEKNKKTFQFLTHEYTKRIENPLRRIAKDRAVEVSPEAQLLLYTTGFFIILGYYCYTINAENKKMMAKFEKSHEEAMRKMERIMKEEAKTKPEPKAEEVEAEVVEN